MAQPFDWFCMVPPHSVLSDHNFTVAPTATADWSSLSSEYRGISTFGLTRWIQVNTVSTNVPSPGSLTQIALVAPPTPQEIQRKLSMHSPTAPVPISKRNSMVCGHTPCPMSSPDLYPSVKPRRSQGPSRTLMLEVQSPVAFRRASPVRVYHPNSLLPCNHFL